MKLPLRIERNIARPWLTSPGCQVVDADGTPISQILPNEAAARMIIEPMEELQKIRERLQAGDEERTLAALERVLSFQSAVQAAAKTAAPSKTNIPRWVCLDPKHGWCGTEHKSKAKAVDCSQFTDQQPYETNDDRVTKDANGLWVLKC